MYIEFPEVHFPVQGLEDIKLPRMVKVKQLFEADQITDIRGHLERQMETLTLNREDLEGKRIAITVGSRGIPHNALIVKTLCDRLKKWRAVPFIVPSMGSHGGGSAEGNLEILAGYGITEETMEVPILSSMEVVQIGELPDEVHTPVYCDKYAAEADGIVLYNKVKPHTDFKGPHESGLLKMMAIGLAKHTGCSWFHKQGFDTFAERIPMVAEVFLQKMPVLFAVGVVQNAYDEISELEVFPVERIVEGDSKLLEIARRRLPRFKFDNIDVLVIDRIGKNISGEGADPNVTGRGFMPCFKDDFHTKRLFIRGLSDGSHNNACGLGLADITTRRCLNSCDWASTWVNLSTNTCIEGGKIPMYQNTDEEALRLAIRTCTKINYNQARVARIRDTLSLSIVEISQSLLPDIQNRADVEILSEPYELDFGADGYLKDL